MSIYYFNPETKDVSDFQGIRSAYPSASIPDGGDVSVLGYFPLLEEDAPAYDKLTQVLVWSIESRGTARGQEFYRKYFVSDLSAPSIKANLDALFIEKEQSYSKQTQLLLDSFARERGYDDIFSAVGYVNSTVPKFKSEAEQCIVLRDQVWSKFYSIIEEAKSMDSGLPDDFSELFAKYPDFVWK